MSEPLTVSDIDQDHLVPHAEGHTHLVHLMTMTIVVVLLGVTALAEMIIEGVHLHGTTMIATHDLLLVAHPEVQLRTTAHLVLVIPRILTTHEVHPLQDVAVLMKIHMQMVTAVLLMVDPHLRVVEAQEDLHTMVMTVPATGEYPLHYLLLACYASW
jgi:hypothetical protein